MTNNERADRIAFILRQHYEDAQKTDLIDLLADARHFCDQQEFDYARLDGYAYTHYATENVALRAEEEVSAPQTFGDAVAEATANVIEELCGGVESSDFGGNDRVYDAAKQTIVEAKEELGDAIAYTWRVWIHEMKVLTIEDAKRYLEEDYEASIIFVFDKHGEGYLAHHGDPLFWPGVSWERYPHRISTLIPSPAWEVVARENGWEQAPAESGGDPYAGMEDPKIVKAWIEDLDHRQARILECLEGFSDQFKVIEIKLKRMS